MASTEGAPMSSMGTCSSRIPNRVRAAGLDEAWVGEQLEALERGGLGVIQVRNGADIRRPMTKRVARRQPARCAGYGELNSHRRGV